MSKKIILDCDPGHDDAVAILLAVGNPNIDLLGVTTVGGNQSIDKVTYNARAVLEKAHATDVPVYRGASRPILRPAQVAATIHGETGLDGVELPEPSRPLETEGAVQFIIDTIMREEPGTVTLVPTGPLTNIALAARLEPRIVERVKEVVLMGGGYNVGNWSAVAEFNIMVDPEAAHIVFNEPWKVTMVGLDLTHQALCTPQVQREIEALDTDLAQFVSGLMDFFRFAYSKNEDFVDPPVHDPCTIAYLIDSSIVQTRRCPVDIELNGTLTLGMTVADFRGPEPSEEECHTQVATKLDFDKFWDLVKDAIQRIG
ncbi:uridine-preferring nucleoside hydrolase UriH [Alloscardovia criceti]|uniref:uridine-preferring nucleoside hydrolase UriH n=1 Tax=Alloscardovia criceti TaxID=356828 RepID=UPI00037D9BE9|nr:nucleoside hydrolase [Alloscardovia criceti]